MALLDACPAQEPPVDLVQRTLNRVAEARQKERFAEQIATLSVPSTSFRISDLLAVAAAVLIAASLTMPMLAGNQQMARRVACASNQGTVGRSLSHYAADNGMALPRGLVSANGKTPWYRVGQTPNPDGTYPSNSAHVRMLIRLRYVHGDTLNCPENADAPRHASPDAMDWGSHPEISYSYQLQTPQIRRIDQGPHLAVLADKNPLFRIHVRNGKIKLEFRGNQEGLKAPSHQHRRQGQNVLTAGGSVLWSTTSEWSAGGDNLWTVQGVDDDYRGTEVPRGPDDVFLVP
jgi:hypothetical protein